MLNLMVLLRNIGWSYVVGRLIRGTDPTILRNGWMSQVGMGGIRARTAAIAVAQDRKSRLVEVISFPKEVVTVVTDKGVQAITNPLHSG
jgi:hypothetical protein